MSYRSRALAAFVLFAAVAAGCGRGAPVASLRTSPAAIRLGYPEAALLHFDWSPSAALEKSGGNPTVFVHVLDGKGAVRRTFDHPFPRPWSGGTPVSYDIELYQSALAAPLPPGTYTLSAGLYDPSSGRRWGLTTGGAERGRHEYRIGAVEVPPAASVTAARFEFVGEWGPVEPDPSVQVLARRRLSGPASLRFSAAPGSQGSLRLALTVHTAALAVESDCAPAAPRRLDPGYHWVGFDLPPSGVCNVRFPDAPTRASGPAETLESAARRATEPLTSLDVAAWRRALR
jgi:hypothetical protein